MCTRKTEDRPVCGVAGKQSCSAVVDSANDSLGDTFVSLLYQGSCFALSLSAWEQRMNGQFTHSYECKKTCVCASTSPGIAYFPRKSISPSGSGSGIAPAPLRSWTRTIKPLVESTVIEILCRTRFSFGSKRVDVCTVNSGIAALVQHVRANSKQTYIDRP
jgi:hypothetical protein